MQLHYHTFMFSQESEVLVEDGQQSIPTTDAVFTGVCMWRGKHPQAGKLRGGKWIKLLYWDNIMFYRGSNSVVYRSKKKMGEEERRNKWGERSGKKRREEGGRKGSRGRRGWRRREGRE